MATMVVNVLACGRSHTRITQCLDFVREFLNVWISRATTVTFFNLWSEGQYFSIKLLPYHVALTCDICNMQRGRDETPMHSWPECKSSWKKLSLPSYMFPLIFVQYLQVTCTVAKTKSGRSLKPMFSSSASATIRRQVMLHVVKRRSNFA